MAGDWIKLRCSLLTHPKVVTLQRYMSVTQCNAIGLLAVTWMIADQHADENGVLHMSAEALDTLLGHPGFVKALEAVGWVAVLPGESLQLVNYLEHNGTTSKTRASSKARVEAHRSAKRKCNARPLQRVTQDRYQRREEKRREEDTTPSSSLASAPEEEGVACGEPPQAAASPPPAPPSPAVMTFPTVGKGPKAWDLTEAHLAEYAEAFPGADVLAEFKKALLWCKNNPTKQKTARGMPQFLATWLTTATNRPARNGQAAPVNPASRLDFFKDLDS